MLSPSFRRLRALVSSVTVAGVMLAGISLNSPVSAQTATVVDNTGIISGTEPFASSADSRLPINDPTCVPTGEILEPVVLIHGTSDNASTWDELIPGLLNDGMCVWAFDYGSYDVTLQNAISSLKGISDLRSSATEIGAQIDYIRLTTGAPKVNLVGHSQGGLMAKYFAEIDGRRDELARVVTVGANFHGTTLNGSGPFFLKLVNVFPRLASFLASSAAIEQLAGSKQMKMVNSYPDTSAGISYTSIYSPSDVTVTPNSASVLNPVPGADVVNIDTVQACRTPVAHPELPRNKVTMSLMRWALTRSAGERPDGFACGGVS